MSKLQSERDHRRHKRLSEVAWQLTNCQETLVALKRDIEAVISEADSSLLTLAELKQVIDTVRTDINMEYGFTNEREGLMGMEGKKGDGNY